LTLTSISAKRTTISGLDKAVHRYSAFSRQGIRERLFTNLFQGLVYPQIWEDPVVDMEALAIVPGDHIVAIASGSCNVLSYLTADPGKITAVDLNHAHIALAHLKIAAVRYLPSYQEFKNFFVKANLRSNVADFDEFILPHLDEPTRRYWQERDAFGRRRISAFARGFYSTGLLGRFIGLGHVLSRLLGANVSRIADAKSLDEQRKIFDESIAPLFDHWFLRWLVKHPASLYGLGIPPAQYAALAGDESLGIHGVLRQRVEKLACGFSIKENYFARQAFGRQYDGALDGALPPYLESENFSKVKSRIGRLDVRHASLTDVLAKAPPKSVNCIVLLDAQDWMSSQQLTDLWRQIGRCAAKDARVIFRTAADERLLPGRVPDDILSEWVYQEDVSARLHARDRSSIYGGFHLYRRSGTS
jgi:S-adenosylmethionine-diacylglycerol 3-amino-3-carboxypropyl transferase